MTAEAGRLLGTRAHDAELAAEFHRVYDFFASPKGLDSLRWRGEDGAVDGEHTIPLYSTARLAHCHLLAHVLGEPEAARNADFAIDALLTRYLDADGGGFADELAPDGSPRAALFSAYGHAFTLLAGASAVECGHEQGFALFEAAAGAIDRLFWDDAVGAANESADRAGPVGSYRGQNANMHLTEAYLAAYEATSERAWLDRAMRLARRFVLDVAPVYGWRVPEHYTRDWEVDAEYGAKAPNDPFRPFGTLPGHALEWSRLLGQLAVLDAERNSSWTSAAVALFERAVLDGWDTAHGGLVYSVDFQGAPVNAHRMHWTIAEGLGAAATLHTSTGASYFADWYDRFWQFTTEHVIDANGGSWWHELDEHNSPARTTWDGKPDLYHAAQALVCARVVRPQGVVHAVRAGALRPA